MKKTLQYFALAFVGLVAASCSDDDIISQGRPVAGDEVIFGAEGAFEKGELPGDTKDSRTAYGDVTGEPGNQKIAINWCEGDQLTIACAESPGAKIATYQVPITAAPEPQPAAVGDVVKPGADNSSSTAGILERVGGSAGIQWGPTTNHFYAVYPSIAKTQKEWGNNGLKWNTNKKVLTGHMPSTYTGTAVEETPTKEGHKVYSVQPSMDYAFMVADAQYDMPQANAGLNFKPIVTALEFDLEMSGLINTESIKTDYIKVGALELKSKTQSIVGNFKYKFGENGTSGSITNTSKLEEGTNSIFLKLATPVDLKVGDRLKATFFIVPTENGDPKVEELLSGDLSLNIMYTDQSFGLFFKKATINHKVDARKKYFFRDMALPPLNPYTTSNWFAQLDDDIYISQLSFPAASHVVSNQYGANSEPNPEFYKEQIHPFDVLWKAGVRGFEMRSSFTSAKDKETISDQEFSDAPFVCAGKPIKGVGGLTLGPAMKKGILTLLDNPHETLVYIMTYQSYGGDNKCGYRPDLYLQGLQNYLTKLLSDQDINKKGITTADQLFVKLNSQSTVADLRGKVAIVVRLYDNAYVDQPSNAKINKANLVPNSTWAPYISVIDDWGTCIDNFDVRYGDTYAREGQFVRGTRTAFEDNMWWGLSLYTDGIVPPSSYGPTHDWHDHAATDPFPSYLLSEYDFKTMPVNTAYQFNVNKGYSYDLGSNTAYVQCWERVFPAYKAYYTGSTSQWNLVGDKARLWYKWPESLNEKLNAIKYITETSIKTKGDNKLKLYINSLAGYFPLTDDIMQGSCNPYYSKVVYSWTLVGHGEAHNVNLNGSFKELIGGEQNGQTTGGDYKTCAAVLNTLYYRYLTSKTAEQFGPLGLVMMDYIGAKSTDFTGLDKKYTDYGINISTEGFSSQAIDAEAAAKACTELPRIIIANNFHFPLEKKVTKTTQTSSPQKMEGNGNIISFE